jgi:hypothetical protein
MQLDECQALDVATGFADLLPLSQGLSASAGVAAVAHNCPIRIAMTADIKGDIAHL